MMQDRNQESRWSPFDPKWYREVFDSYTSTAEELFNRDLIIRQGYHLPDQDGSRSSVFRDDAVLNPTFNEEQVRDTLRDIYVNSTPKLIASNHDNTHFFSWYGTMSDMKIIANTNTCELIIPTDTFISPDARDQYKLKQFYRRWITPEDILNNWDVFHWCCLLFVNQKIYSEYELRMDDHETTIRFSFPNYWYKQNFPIYLYKMDTNAQCRVKISRELCENQWDWKVPMTYLSNPRIRNSKHVIVAFNKISDPDIRKDGVSKIEVLGDNLEFLTPRDGYLDLTNISAFNKQYIRSERKEWLWMTVIVPKFFHEYPIILPADVIYRPYEANFQKVSIIEGDVVDHVKADVTGKRSADQIYVDVNGGPNEKNTGWAQMIRPIVLSDAYDGIYDDPYVSFLDDLRELRDATVDGADYVESMRFEYRTRPIDEWLDQLVVSMTNIHDVQNKFMDKLLIQYNQEYETRFKSFLGIVDEIRAEGMKSEWLTADQKSAKNLWNYVSPLIYIPRNLVDRYNIIETTNMVQQNPLLWDEHEHQQKLRYQHPIAVEDFWTFEFNTKDKVWRPIRLNVSHQFPDIYLLDDAKDITGRIFKAFFFYSDTMNIRNPDKDIVRATPAWDEDVESYHNDPGSTYRDIFMEKFYWMGVRSIYRGYLLTGTRWEALEYVIDNESYTRFNDLFMKTIDPSFKLGVATYLKSEHFNFPLDDAISKLQESINQKWLGYQKITNFETYLSKNWKPSFIDSVVKITKEFDPEERLMRRPNTTFDQTRLLETLKQIQANIQIISNRALDEFDWILMMLQKESYGLNVQEIQNLRDMLAGVVNNTGDLLIYIESTDPALFSIDDVHHILAGLLRYQTFLETCTVLAERVYQDLISKRHYPMKEDALSKISDTMSRIPGIVNRIQEILLGFDMERFMEGANELRTYLEYDKNNPQDNSLLGHMNRFNDAWTNDVKKHRNAFFSSSAVFYGTFVPNHMFTDADLRKFMNRLDRVVEDLKALQFSVNEFYRTMDYPVDQTVLDRLEYTMENLELFRKNMQLYVETRNELVRCVITIESEMDRMQDPYHSGTEDGYNRQMGKLGNSLIASVSYVANGRILAERSDESYKGMQDIYNLWKSFVKTEKEVFDRLETLVVSPVEFINALNAYQSILDALTYYLQNVSMDYEPDREQTAYCTVYQASGIEIVSGGFHHKEGDLTYSPDLGVMRVQSIGSDIQEATSLKPATYRSTTFRNPITRRQAYESMTNGAGLGILLRPTEIRKTPLVVDEIISPILDRMDNGIKLIKATCNRVNPYSNAFIREICDTITNIVDRWKSLRSSASDHMSATTIKKMDTVVQSFLNLRDEILKLIAATDLLDLEPILNDVDAFIDQANQIALHAGVDESEYDALEDTLLESYDLLRNFYGDGSLWSDHDEAKRLLVNLQPNFIAFFSGLPYEFHELQESYQRILDKMLNVEVAFAPAVEQQNMVANGITAFETAVAAIKDLRNDAWYRIKDMRIAEPGSGYCVGDIVRLNDDGVLVKILQVEDGRVIEITPFMDYALPYKMWGIYNTTREIGNGKGLTIDVFCYQVTADDILNAHDQQNLGTIKPYDENDMVEFRFSNIHDLDVHYEVFIGGKQTMNFIQRHDVGTDPLHPRSTDSVYLHANDVMHLKNKTFDTPAEDYLVYRVNDVRVVDPGAGYSVGQEIFVDNGISVLRLRVTKLDGTPTKGIKSVEIVGGNLSLKKIDPTNDHAEVVPDSMSNIDEEYNTGYYDRIPAEGITKPATWTYSVSEYPFVSSRFDELENGDRNATFLYELRNGPGDGDPDEHLYIGMQAGDDIWNRAMAQLPATDGFIPDGIQLPPGLPPTTEFQRILEMRLHRDGDPVVCDLVVPTFKDLPRNTDAWPDGCVGKRIVVQDDETHDHHTMLYQIRTFTTMGYFIFDYPIYADNEWNKMVVDWMNCDYRPDLPCRKVQYPTAPYDTAKKYVDITHEITDQKHEPTGAPKLINNTSYIKDLTVDDLSVFNWTTKAWEDLHDETRWKLTVRDDYEKREWGFTLEFLGDGAYSYQMALYLNKTPSSLSRNVPLKRNAVVEITAGIAKEVHKQATSTPIDVGNDIRIRKLFPFVQTETFIVTPKEYTMNFKVNPYMHFRNELHLEDIVVYNKTARRFEDILNQDLFEVRFKDPKANRRGMESITMIDQVSIGDAGKNFVDGEAWAYNAEYGILIFGTVEIDPYSDGNIRRFTPIHTENMPTQSTALVFHVFQNNTASEIEPAKLIVRFLHEERERFGDGYLHNVHNRMAPLPDEFQIIVQYQVNSPIEYEITVDKSAHDWEFTYPAWSVSPTFHIKGYHIPKSRLYVTTEDGRLPRVNPLTGGENIDVVYTADGMDITVRSLYRRYERVWIHSVPYPMRSVFTLRKIPLDGYLNIAGRLNKPLSKKYYEFWVNGRLLSDEVTIITPTKVFFHGLTSLHNLEIIEINRDPNEYFSNIFLHVMVGKDRVPRPYWDFTTYLDDALQGTLDGDNYTLEEQESLLTPVWRQVDRSHPEFAKYPPNGEVDSDFLDVVKEDDTYAEDVGGHPPHDASVVDAPTIEGKRIAGKTLKFEQFGVVPMTDEELMEILNEEWKAEIADPTIKFPPHTIINDTEWYGMAARLYDGHGVQVYHRDGAAYHVIDNSILRINTETGSAKIIPNPVEYDLD